MNGMLWTTKEVLREHDGRLRSATCARQANEAYRRMKIRSSLRRAIAETLRLDGDIQELATEFDGLVRRTERRLSGRPCC